MKVTITLITGLVALSTAQVIFNSTTGRFTCPAPNGAYCADDSLSTNIIIRCNNGTGYAGNCNDNLAGEFPRGVNNAPCWETSERSGDAACSKNCVVYRPSNGTFTLPGCTPTTTNISSSAALNVSRTTLAGLSVNTSIPFFIASNGGYIGFPEVVNNGTGLNRTTSSGSTDGATSGSADSETSTSAFSYSPINTSPVPGAGAVICSAGSLIALSLFVAVCL